LFKKSEAGDVSYDQAERVTIKAQEFTPVPELDGRDVPEAFLLNSDDWGYGVFIIDELSQKFFENNLGGVKDKLNYSQILTQFIIMMRQILYPATRFPILLNQTSDLDNENLVRAMQGALLAAKGAFLPNEMVPGFCKDVCDFFLKKALKEANQGNTSMCKFCT
jgi:hypothetical protein